MIFREIGEIHGFIDFNTNNELILEMKDKDVMASFDRIEERKKKFFRDSVSIRGRTVLMIIVVLLSRTLSETIKTCLTTRRARTTQQACQELINGDFSTDFDGIYHMKEKKSFFFIFYLFQVVRLFLVGATAFNL